jgi:frizzled protein 5/8
MAIGVLWLGAMLTLCCWTVWSVDGLTSGPGAATGQLGSAISGGSNSGNSGSSSPVLAVKKDARCEEITIPMCRGIGYNWTSMPNSLHHGKYTVYMFTFSLLLS